MENRKIYASDGSYSLCRLTEDDKDEYMNLLREVNTIPHFYDSQMNCNIMWKIAIDGNDWEFSIFNNKGNYCGNIILKYPDSEHPEIGIDIAAEYQNQGIAPKIIKMLARKAYEERNVEYYIIRVSSKNLHSKHMVEKLGVVPDDSEDIFLKRVAGSFQKEFKESEQEAKERAEKLLREEDEQIYQYRYLPEVFLK
jgi:RimJ/RimL family protein N-acetyltransferase